ncbi:hypothetical protein GGS20DRAFT_577901 [Poronia punctata]|nr:hypothetical protein GGS20DRAFT_577901 [Poronia punctata]
MPTTAKAELPPTPATPSYNRDDVRTKRRAKAIDIDEANHPNVAKLSLYTPALDRGQGPRELICLCPKAPKVPRPRNAFILYRQSWQSQIAKQHPGLANPEISKLIGEKWHDEPEHEKAYWKNEAEQEKIRHQRQYPGYRYQPRRGGKNGSGKSASLSEDTPGRCPRCGGRYIATPRTPTTPFGVASPPPPPPPERLGNMQPYMQHATNHQRHGSSSSGGMIPVDANGRRYTQPYHHRDMDDDYPMMSPTGTPHPGMVIPPEGKRRRYNGVAVYVPGSPHMGYDPRYPPRPSISGPPLSATGQLPRPPQYRTQGYSGHPAMQPPPPPPPSRQNMPYSPIHTPGRPKAGFDESLRLPPLQTTQIQETEPGARQITQQPQSAGGIRTQPQSQAQPQSPIPPPKWTFQLKLELLRIISPPLQWPRNQTRGPIIAVEGGAPTSVLKDVAGVIEKSLSASLEFAVKVWSEDNTTSAIAHTSPGHHENAEGGVGLGIIKQSSSSLISPIANYVARILKWHKTSEDLVRYITTPKEESEKLPVALISDGYSLTFSDRYAAALHINDRYGPPDHWQWVATLWRGIVGADLTVYVKKGDTASVEMVAGGQGVMVLNVPEGGKIDEKLERRLGFEIAEWVRAGNVGAGYVRE